ncbi:MAG TPA: hypothetical protein VEP30_01115 [Chthoniobacterales bacterium]|nr:hypothetical protein [Chthoniobacterales bacterium]
MSLNVLALQEEPNANITDLHAFVVDRAGHRIADAGRLGEAERLVISLCVRRALQPTQTKTLNFDGYKFRVHLDFNPKVRFVPETKGPDGRPSPPPQIEDANKTVNAKAAALKEANTRGDADAIAMAQGEWQAAVKIRGDLINAYQSDRSMQDLYGGVIMEPEGIVDNGVMEFELGVKGDGDNAHSFFTHAPVFTGFIGPAGKINDLTSADRDNLSAQMASFPPETIHVLTNIFDDPFIFPRFFRRNVVGIVASIPLTAIPKNGVALTGSPEPPVHGPILLWATTHHNGQIDHVGRSLRTQLPRLGYLNPFPPRDHVKQITRVHAYPTVMEDILATFLAPLEAHRHYDSSPDVMVYDLRKPASFPNGRWLEDDVAQTLAQAGETLLLELAYAESKEFPRATTNDKKFGETFPYLADRWTKKEIDAVAPAGSTMDNYPVPRAPEAAAIAAPNLKITTWRTLWRVEVIVLVILALLLLFSVRTWGARWLTIALTLLGIWFLCFVYADPIPAGMNGAMEQPNSKLLRVLGGAGLIFAFLLAWFYNLGRRSCKWWPAVPIHYPKGKQEVTAEDLKPSSFEEIRDALFNPDLNGQYYRAWKGPGENNLPILKQPFASLARGLIVRFWKDFAMLSAAKRTLRSHADLRWGPDGKGFHRLVHGMGICLEGTWQIDENWSGPAYTGYFAPGMVGRVIARYSLGGNDPRNGRNRSLGLVGKIFPLQDGPGGITPRAHFITQEDLGGAFTNSILDVDLTNSPPVTLLKRGSGLLAFLVVIVALLRADRQPSERQLYEIAELEKPEGTPTSCPRFMRLKLITETPPPDPNDWDFRDEILGLMYKRGDTEPSQDLVFRIEVSEKGRRTLLQRVLGQEWKPIGTLTFKQAVASHNGDFVVHFHHPVWRKDRNDPTSVARRDLRSLK